MCVCTVLCACVYLSVCILLVYAALRNLHQNLLTETYLFIFLISVSTQTTNKNTEDYTRSTLRQTQVLVIPANNDLNDSFAVFDRLIQVINEARRNARDYVTDYSLEKLDDKMYGGGSSAVDRDWV